MKRALLLALCGITALGCRDLERFDTEGNEAYCGDMVGPPFNEGFLPENANPPTIGMSLTFDIHQLATTPGAISTDDSDQGMCAPEPLFADAKLRSVQAAFHDPISQMDFGDGRDQNILVWVDSTCKGTLLGVVSLMRNDSIEVRLFKPEPEPSTDTPKADRPGFAQWKLKRKRNGCAP